MTRQAPTAFWRFSLRLYARPGVESACLWLQDHWGADVNLLLLCCWLGREGRVADRRLLREARAAVAAWRREVVLPLRQVRRRLGKALPNVGAERATPVRRATQAAELEAEHVEQLLLAERAVRLPAGTRRGAAAANLALYADLLGASGPGLERRLAVLVQAGAAAAARRRSGGRRWSG